MKPSVRLRLLLLAAPLLLVGCAGVEPWQRETLASYVMRPDRDPAASRLGDHMWTSREAASGGGRVGGGGCGCN